MTDRNRDFCRPLRPNFTLTDAFELLTLSSVTQTYSFPVLKPSSDDCDKCHFFPGIPSTLLPQDVALTDCLNPDPNTEKVKKNADFNGTTQNMGKINVEAISFWRATD